MLYAIFQSYKARHLTTEFGESKYVFRALQISLLVILIGTPVLKLAQDNTNASVFLNAVMLFVLCTSILLTIFVPKIQYLKQEGNNDERFQASLRLMVDMMTKSSIEPTGHSSSEGQVDSFRSNGPIAQNGIQIYGAKSKEQLIMENETLRMEVAVLRRRFQPSSKTGTVDDPPDPSDDVAFFTSVLEDYMSEFQQETPKEMARETPLSESTPPSEDDH